MMKRRPIKVPTTHNMTAVQSQAWSAWDWTLGLGELAQAILYPAELQSDGQCQDGSKHRVVQRQKCGQQHRPQEAIELLEQDVGYR